MNIDQILMDFKLRLRAVSKPGDDLWDIIPEEIINQNSDTVYKLQLVLGEFQGQELLLQVDTFDDCGEWELRRPKITYSQRSLRLWRVIQGFFAFTLTLYTYTFYTAERQIQGG